MKKKCKNLIITERSKYRTLNHSDFMHVFLCICFLCVLFVCLGMYVDSYGYTPDNFVIIGSSVWLQVAYLTDIIHLCNTIKASQELKQ